MGKPLTIADVLDATITRHYGTAKAFAEAADVDGSSVSRWRRGEGRPSGRLLQQMQPYILDDRGKPVPLLKLLSINFPERTGGSLPDVAIKPVHPLVRDLDWMLAEDSPIPPENRDALANLVETIVSPYRSFRRKRRAV